MLHNFIHVGIELPLRWLKRQVIGVVCWERLACVVLLEGQLLQLVIHNLN